MTHDVRFEKFLYYLKPFSQAYWLRPFNAIWRAYEAAFFDFELISKKNLYANWVDLGVGDGIFSTLATGLPIPKNFDAYKWLKYAQDKTVDLEGLIDNFDTPPKANIYDYSRWHSLIDRRNKTKFRWAMGIDHKKNMLLKAEKLGSFRNLREASLNKPESLFNTGEDFNLCFSNSLYWSKNPMLVLKNIRKHIIPSNGPNLVLSLQLTNFKKFKESNFDNFGELVDLFDKDRKLHYKSVYGPEEWSKIIENCDFKITECSFFANKYLVNCIEWLDNRELYQYFASLHKKVKVKDQIKIRSEVSDYIQELGIQSFKSKLFEANQASASYFLIKAIAI